MNSTTNVTHGELTTERTERSLAMGGSFVEAIGGIAAIVLAIIGLANAGWRNDMLAITTIVLGASLLLEGGAIAASFRRAMFLEGAGELGGAASFEFLAGVTGIVLGILALIGVGGANVLNTFVSVSVIVFGASLLLGGAAASHFSSGGQMLVGLGAVVLGILAVIGINAVILNLVALIVLGVSVLLSGTSLGARAMMQKRVEHISA